MLEKQKVETRNKRTPLEQVVPLATPFIIFIDPCGTCNFKCNFCPCNMSNYNKKERHKVMSLSLFKKVIDEICTFPEKVKVIYLYGFGEPLLNRKIIEMAKYLKKSKACNEIRIVTNGSLLSPKMNDQLVDSGIDLVRISIEALTEIDYKEICDIDIDYSSLLNNIEDLYKKSRGKLKVAAKIVNTTIKTGKDLENFLDVYMPITDFCFVEDIVDGWPEFEKMVSISNKTIEAKNWIWKTKKYKRCSFSLTMMMLHSNGDISPCPNDWKHSLNFGNIEQDNIVNVWNSAKWHDFQLMHLEQDRKTIPFCRECICSGYDSIDHVADEIANNIRKHITKRDQCNV
jgi:radical SAM protein with 4Fe4S-binding SPASM domain